MFLWQEQYHTRSLCSLVRYFSCYWNKKIHIFSPPFNIRSIVLRVCILTRPTGSSKYSTTGKNIQRYYTPKHLITYIYEKTSRNIEYKNCWCSRFNKRETGYIGQKMKGYGLLKPLPFTTEIYFFKFASEEYLSALTEFVQKLRSLT